MKSKEFIKQLRELDPEGNAEVCVDNGDVLFFEPKPWYYDGRAKIFIRDENGEVIGLREATADDGFKICVHTKTARDLGWEAVENQEHGYEPREYIIQGREGLYSIHEEYEKGKKEARECYEEMNKKKL